MYNKTSLDRPQVFCVVAAALATVVAIGIFALLVALFQSRGMPMAEVAVAERACAAHAYISERQSCITERLAALHGTSVARR